jgi:Xaa-Pro aminopeptidase
LPAPIEPISAREHAERRRRFQAQLGEGVAILPGARLATRSNDTQFAFRQNSDLFYLTGFPQPDAVAVLTRDRFCFFVQPRDPEMETWNGRRPGIEGAVRDFGADEAHPSGELRERLPALLEDRPRLYHSFGFDRELDDAVVAALQQVRAKVRRGVRAPAQILSPHDLLHEMRIYKSPAELAIMRAAAGVSREAHRAAAQLCQPGRHEYELEAALHAVFRSSGGSGPAYNSIVGAGDNATILHYVENSAELRAGQLVLIDAGVELHGYASDVTRVYPVGGRYTGAARDVYQAVLDAQLATLDAVRPGVALKELHDVALRKLVEGLVALGALSGDVDELLTAEAYKPFYMHSTGHLLGLDVHDAGQYSVDGKPRALEPGMCFTVEPGLYFGEREPRCPERLRGIGVRIEDDVVITPDGFEVLTSAIPKRIDDVETWIRD